MPVAPRERKPALAALAVLLILVGALGATVLVLRAGDKVAAIQITEDVASGSTIPSGSVKQVMVPKDTEISYVPWEQRTLLGKYRANGDLVKGSLLVGQNLSKGSGIGAGEVLATLSLKPGQYPVGLQSGNYVAVYRIEDNAAGASDDKGAGAGSGAALGDEPIAPKAKVQDVEKSDGGSFGGGGFTVTLRVKKEEAAAVASASFSNKAAVVQVSGGSS
ncbi:hypothetical protein [Streptomyces boninensis]|uniref:hypothetical protein n=1 Tax=Streptomyces boninensis TaxID=2039455 RepID=UPI003B2109B7